MQGYIPGADGRCRCNAALSANCLQCVVPGTCGPTPQQSLTGPVCQLGFALVTDPAAPNEPGKCVCVPSTAGPNCDACVVPGVCAACSGVFVQVNGVCGALLSASWHQLQNLSCFSLAISLISEAAPMVIEWM